MRGQFRIFPAAVAGIEAVTAETGHSFAKHTHDRFGIGLIKHGAQRSLSGRGVVEARAGDIIAVNPNEVHDGMPIGGARSWSMLYFDPGVFAELLAGISGRTGGAEIPYPVIRSVHLTGQFNALFAVMTGEQDGAAALRRDELLLLLAAAVMEGRETIAAAERQPPAAIRHARSLIDDDPAAAVTLDDLAAQSGLSRFQLVRAFAKATGLTPHAYLLQRRIHRARRLIAAGTPLAEAAFAAGFADQSHMTRIFVRSYGVTPGAYAGAVR